MPRLDRTEVAAVAVFVAAFAVADALGSAFMAAPFLSARQFVVLCACVAWALSLQQRIVHARLRRLLAGIAGMLAALVVLQLMKYQFTVSGSFTNRLCWYAYYVPLTWIPLLSLFAALSVGTSDAERPFRRWVWLAVPALALSVLLPCNDAHQLAFAFSGPVETWGEAAYAYGPLYFLEVAWIAALLVSALAVAVARCARRVGAPSVVLALVPLALDGAYLMAYAANGARPLDFALVHKVQFQDAFCFMVIGFWEALVQAGVIPSNTGYARLFGAAAFPAAITDDTGTVCYETALPLAAGAAERAAASTGPVALAGDRVLHSMAIPGGRVLWSSDLSNVHAARAELQDVRERQVAHNAALQTQSQLAEEKARLTAQARIHEQCASELEGTLAEIDALATALNEAEGVAEREALQRCLFLGSYAKRRANLRLVAYAQGSVPSSEVTLALSESAAALQCAGVECAVRAFREGAVAPEAAVAAYDTFQAIADAALRASCNEMLAVLDGEEGLALRVAIRPGGSEGENGNGNAQDATALRKCVNLALAEFERNAERPQPMRFAVFAEDGMVYAHAAWRAGGAA